MKQNVKTAKWLVWLIIWLFSFEMLFFFNIFNDIFSLANFSSITKKWKTWKKSLKYQDYCYRHCITLRKPHRDMCTQPQLSIVCLLLFSVQRISTSNYFVYHNVSIADYLTSYIKRSHRSQTPILIHPYLCVSLFSKSVTLWLCFTAISRPLNPVIIQQ